MKKFLLPLLINPFPFRPRNNMNWPPSEARRLPPACEILIGGVFLKLLERNSLLVPLRGTRNGRAGPEPSPPASYGIDAINSEAESINNFKFLIELSITQLS